MTESRQQLFRQYKSTFDQARKIVNSHDPEGLLAVGAPKDEYDPEIEDFLRILVLGESISAEAVIEVWTKWFGTDSELLHSSNKSELRRFVGELQTLAVD